MGNASKTVYQTCGFVLQDELRDHRYYLPSFAQRGTISGEVETSFDIRHCTQT